MSIVEKAIGRLNSSGKDRKKLAAAMVPIAAEKVARAALNGATSKNVVNTHQMMDQGFICILDDQIMARAFRFLKRPLLSRVFGTSRNTPAAGHVVLVTSGLPGAGKSFVTFNLAASIAQEKMMKVLLIDADPLRRNLTSALGQTALPGLLEILSDDEISVEDIKLETDLPGLHFIPCGQPHERSTELLASKHLNELLESLDDGDTLVLLDSPPLLLTSEARVLAEKVDHTLVIVEAGCTTVADMTAVLKMLGETETSVSIILNKATKFSGSIETAYYEYGY